MRIAISILKKELKIWEKEYSDSRRLLKSCQDMVKPIIIIFMREEKNNIHHLQKAIKILNEVPVKQSEICPVCNHGNIIIDGNEKKCTSKNCGYWNKL